MDEVVEQLEAAEIGTNESRQNNTSFDVLYKNWGKLSNQEERRIRLLEIQKRPNHQKGFLPGISGCLEHNTLLAESLKDARTYERQITVCWIDLDNAFGSVQHKLLMFALKCNRNANLDRCRGIWELMESFEEEDNVFVAPETRSYYRPTIYVAGFNKAPTYGSVLMRSEWLIEKPSDFEENWVVVPCPKGKRVLVIAREGRTKIFNKSGHFMFCCSTALPGGNLVDSTSKKKYCVLDCFYQKKGNVLHVLDVLAWNSQSMADGELEFRDYWIRSHFFDMDETRVLSEKNNLIFSILPKVSCAEEIFSCFMKKVHFKNPENDLTVLDGLLFYHKKAQYFSGETPLVGWLYPFMVPEVLGSQFKVHPVYMVQKPRKYTNQADYIDEFKKRTEKRELLRRLKLAGQMDALNGESDGESNIESMEAEGAVSVDAAYTVVADTAMDSSANGAVGGTTLLGALTVTNNNPDKEELIDE